LITEEALRRWTERIGVKLRIGNLYNTEATRDSIRHFADGIGDPNPLWRDEDYARRTSYGTLVAPPSWLYSVFPTWIFQGLPGVHGFHAANAWTFYKPVLLNDKIAPECIFTGFEVRRSEFAGKAVHEFQRAKYYNQRGELVAVADSLIIRTERRAARERGRELRRHVLPHPWTEEELKRIEEEMLSEGPRGSTPRFWEDVEEGEELKLTKGPLGLTDMISFFIAANTAGLRAFHCALKLYRQHPAWAVRDPNTYALEPIFSVHYNKYVANLAGLPYPYDVGVQRQCYLIQMITNWMGDEGWLKKNYCEYRGFVYHSDVLWFRGKVVRKYVDDDGEPCVDIETHAINQRGEDTMPGRSTVVLPSREHGYWPVEARLKGRIGMGK
jgi:acyl dehydratase